MAGSERDKMTGNSVLCGVEGAIATVTLNRPDVHNAFDEDVIAALSHIWDDLSVRDDVLAVILRGGGKSFSAGGDLNWMKRAASYSTAENERDGMALATMLHKLYMLPKVTIACVHGAAMGGGMGLVSCCDIVLATPEAVFALSEVRLGLIPATIAPYVLRAIGERQFRRYAQTAERIGAERAREIGLVHELFADDMAMTAGLENILSALRLNGHKAMRESKKLCTDLAGQPLTQDMIAETARRIARTRAGDEAKEGLSAFLEKRKAVW